MKLLTPLLLAATLFCSCAGKRRSADADSVADTAADFSRLRSRLDDTDEMGRTTDRLKALAPLGTEGMKALLPEELNGYKQTGYGASPQFASADYEKSPGVGLRLSIQDCAGEEGATTYTLQYWNVLNAEEENEFGYTRPTKLAGTKAIETYKKASMEVRLMWFTATRLLVVLEGQGLDPAVLRQAAETLSFKP